MLLLAHVPLLKLLQRASTLAQHPTRLSVVSRHPQLRRAAFGPLGVLEQQVRRMPKLPRVALYGEVAPHRGVHQVAARLVGNQLALVRGDLQFELHHYEPVG